MPKYFVTGASGMLGTTLYNLAQETGDEIISTDIGPLDPWTQQLDIRDKAHARELIKAAKPDWVLNLAALTDVEYCELNSQHTYDVNGQGAENIAMICKELGLPMVHIGTAGVFDGTRQTPYTEDDTPNPLMIYGKAKHAGDLAVQRLLDRYFIFRAGWMMGAGDRDKKFVRKILNQIDAGTHIKVLTDKYGCPTYTRDFAKGILTMTKESTDYGLYHMVAEGNCSRYDVAVKIVDILGIKDVAIEPVVGAAVDDKWPVMRPNFEVIEDKKLHDRGLKLTRYWEDGLRDYLNLFYKDRYGSNRNKEVYRKPKLFVVSQQEPLVSIIATGYKNTKFNQKYFDTVNKQTYKNIEVIFVDNLSPDETTTDAYSKLVHGKVVRSLVNTGCAGGNNLGVKEAYGKFIFILNPDTWIDEHCVENLVKAALNNENNIYTSKQLAYDGGMFYSCGIAADLFGYPARTYTIDGSKQIRKIFYADGTNIFISKENYLKLGMMDAETFLFAEDVDLSWKAHLCGMSVVPVPDSVVYHWSGGGTGIGGYPKDLDHYETNADRRFLAERNMIRNIIKNYSWWNIPWILAAYVAINFVEFCVLSLTGQFEAAVKSYVNAYIWNIENIKSTLKKRQHIQSIRTIDDLAIIKKMHITPHKLLAFLELGVPTVNS